MPFPFGLEWGHIHDDAGKIQLNLVLALSADLGTVLWITSKAIDILDAY